MSDDVKVSISTELEEDDDESYLMLNLSFPLKNGSGCISIVDDYAVAEYHSKTGEVIKEIEFNARDFNDMRSSFNLALKGIMAADKQNSQTKAKSNPSISEYETLDLVRAEFSRIN